MELNVFDGSLIASLGPLLTGLENELAVAGLFFLGTTALVALCVPGVLIPIAVSSGSLLGWAALPVVALGALAGSQLLFLAVRHLLAARARARLGARLDGFERRFARYGLWYVVALRLCGAPHFAVTAASALLPLRPTAFAVATLAGFVPVIAMAAAAGSAL